jgi:uncharacterized membrane protein
MRPSGGVVLFPGPPSGARSFLSAIVQAMISFTAVVFSITVVVLQLSSSQYPPRVLRRFLRDRLIQSALGVFVATFAYAMVVLRAVQGGSGAGQAGFVPRLLFQVQGRPGRQDGGDRGHDDERQWRAALFRHVAFDTERTMEQDAAFGFRQLADIALQALSPAVNAPTTAAQVIDELHDLLRRLVTAPPPGGCYHDDDGALRLIVPQYDIAAYLRLAIEEIWHYGHGSPQIPVGCAGCSMTCTPQRDQSTS